MDAGKASMNSVARRTRSRWDEYYRNQYNELLKVKNEQSGDSDGRGKRARNGDDSDCIFLSGDGGRNRGDVKKSIECVESSGSKRSRNVSRKRVETGKDNGDAGKKHEIVFGGGENSEHFESSESMRSRNVSGKSVAEGKDNNVASEKKRKLDMRSEFDDEDDVVLISDDDVVSMSDDDVVFLGEQVVSNGSSLKTGPESRSGSGSKLGDLDKVLSNSFSLKIGPESGSGSKVGNLDEVVSSVSKTVESTKVRSGSWEDSGKRGRGRPQIKPLDEEQMHCDVCVDLERSINSRNSTESSDGSDNSDSESESTSEEDDEQSDEDYRVGESSTAESSDDSDSSNDVELQTDDEYDGEAENLHEGEEENLPTKVEEKRTLLIHKNSTGTDARKEIDDEQEKEDESYEGYNVEHYRSNHCKRSSNQQKLDDVVIFISEKEKFPSTGMDKKSIGMDARKESDDAQENGDESNEGYNVDHYGSNQCKRSSNQQKLDDVLIIINEEDKFSSVRRSRRNSVKKETEELERDTEVDEGYHETNDSRGHNKASANWKKDHDMAIIIGDEQKFPSIRKSAKKNNKGDGVLDSTRIFESLSSYGCTDKASRRISMKKETKVELERDDEVDEGYHESNDGSGHDKTSANWKKDEDVALIIDDEKFPNIRKSAEKNKEGDGGLDSTRIFDPHSNYGCMDKASKDRDTFSKRKSGAAKDLDLIKILVESMNALKEQQFTCEENALNQNTLPLRFRFEDEVLPPPEKSEWEKHIDSLFCDLELGLRESEIDCTDSSVMENDDLNSKEIDESPAACCGRGEHQPILDEQIGIICRYCYAVILEIRYVLPDFYVPPSRRQDCKDSDESPSSFTSQIQFPGSACNTTDSTSCARGTVWDLIPGIRKEMFPHQREGFEFLWKNIAGAIVIEKLKDLISDGRGCIISHAPGTGKTRMTIMFLQTFMKLYPTCCPVIVAPKGVLLTWESEFIKWNVNIPFHILNKEELTGTENAVATKIFGHIGAGGLSKDCIRLLKMYSWSRGGSILGISYTLFKNLAGENGKEGQHEKIREVLLERPGLLVLDEGHTPRNERSRIWNVLERVTTQRRIILSGTPFQNNMKELYNTLCLVNPKFVNRIVYENNTSCKTHRKKYSVARKRWINFVSSIGENRDEGLKKLRAMLDPFVHVHKGTIKETLPGLRHTLVFLHPTDYQKTLHETSSKERNILRRIRMVSLVSVHPSLEAVMTRYPAHKSKLEEIESDPDAGVKTKFLMKLIWLADALGERVLVFSQFIDPLVFIQKQIELHFSWNEGREVLFMDGKLDEKQRQDSISAFNDDTTDAKVLLASTRACSEGINLIGASRVVLLDIVWNPSVEKQAISRAYRLGQKKVVYVYRLFTSGMEVRQYAQQFKKEHISQLIFSPGDGSTCQSEKLPMVSEDKVLEAMLNNEKFNHIFEKIIYEPKESNLIEIFGLAEQN